MKRKLLSLLLTLTLVCTLFVGLAPTAKAASNSCGTDLMTWAFDKETGNLTISGAGKMYFSWQFAGSVFPWEGLKDQIRKVTIFNGPSYVASEAFENCVNLINVEIDYAPVQLAAGSFAGCTSLKQIDYCGNFGTGSISSYAFTDCTSLKHAHFTGSFPKIEDGAFSNCDKDFTICIDKGASAPDSCPYPVKEWDNVYDYKDNGCHECRYTDNNAPTVTSANHINGSNSCPSWVFDSASGTLTFDTSSMLGSIYPVNKFRDTTPWSLWANRIRKIDFGEYGYIIGSGVFTGCTSLTELELPDRALTIKSGAFSYCTSLSSIVIPERKCTIEENAFVGCEKLTDVTVLSTDCTIDPSAYTLGDPAITTIHAFSGSTAEAYAKANGYRFVSLDQPALAFESASLSLQSSIVLNFKVAEATLVGWTNPYMVFSKNGKETTVTAYDTADGCRTYRFCDLTPADMATTVTATLYATDRDGVEQSVSMDYSIRDYAANQLAASEDTGLKTLLADMMNYGAAASAYWKSGANPGSGLEAELAQYATVNAPEMTSHLSIARNPNAKVRFVKASLSLREKVSINYYLDVSDYDGEVENLKFLVEYLDEDGTRNRVAIMGKNFVQRSDGLYVVTYDGLNAAQMRTVCDAWVVDLQWRTWSDTLSYSIESYAAAMAHAGDPALTALLEAMMKYGDSTAAYFAK